MNRGRLRHLLAAVAGIAVLLAVAFVPSPQTTEATWTDSEHAQASFTALKLYPPRFDGIPMCNRPPLLGGNFLRIRWGWPTSGAPYDQLGPADVMWTVGNLEDVQPPTTGPDGSGMYVSTFSTGLLSGLVGGLLGVNLDFEAQTTFAGWTSADASKVLYNAPVLAGVSCTIQNGPTPP